MIISRFFLVVFLFPILSDASCFYDPDQCFAGKKTHSLKGDRFETSVDDGSNGLSGDSTPANRFSGHRTDDRKTDMDQSCGEVSTTPSSSTSSDSLRLLGVKVPDWNHIFS